MTLLGRLATLFPITHLSAILVALLWFVWHPAVVSALTLIFNIYLLPPLLFRAYCLRHPAKAGRWVISNAERCDWWIAHQMQMIYAAVPAFEAFLRFMPGVYSAWLRLWGSKVGKNVYWTPMVEIIDRHMLRIGDDVIFGHKVICTSHVVSRKDNGEFVLLLRPVRIGSGTFIGALSRLGPGVKIPAKSAVPYDTEYRFSYAE
ncbi:MAG: acyl transferase [Candidatus Melainabacteria bacterium]|nr:acyl transferase [Candidatus Melainabacteria bacterium]